MLEASLKNKIKKFYYISSSEVYGDIQTFPIKNLTPLSLKLSMAQVSSQVRTILIPILNVLDWM